MVRLGAKREEAQYLQKSYKVSANRTCRLLSLNRSSFDYKPRPKTDEPISIRLKELAGNHRRFGHPRLFELLKREGIKVNHKRSERIYQNLKLQIKYRKRKKLGSVTRITATKAEVINECWGIDFMHDFIESGRKLKILTIVDEKGKESPGALVDTSITGENVTEFLDTLSVLPSRIRVDQGTEFTSCAFLNWAYKRGIEIQFSGVGKPNAEIEAFNSRMRDECLNEHVFFSLEDAREKINQWLDKYNTINPHSTLGMKTPKEFAKQEGLMLTG